MATKPSSNISRFAAVAMVAAGALIMIGAVFADELDIGGEGRGFGWKQLIAAIAGLVILLIGIAWLIHPGITSLPDEDD
jgi:hypothetical protein